MTAQAAPLGSTGKRSADTSANGIIEAPPRIEPDRLENTPEAITDVSAELSAASAALGARLHPPTVTNLADVVRAMNCNHGNLIEGHDARPRDIERALTGEFDQAEKRRNLQIEAAAHVRLQEKIDRMAAEHRLPEPASRNFVRWLHSEFYRDAPEAMRYIESGRVRFRMTPGEWRSEPAHDVSVGRHLSPSSHGVEDFMAHFERRYRFEGTGRGTRILVIAAAHHRFNYIKPFPDGNGRVSRLMSHTMAQEAGIGAHGLWSIARGLAQGFESRREYKALMNHADFPRQGDLDGRGNLSHRALIDFTLWFLKVLSGPDNRHGGSLRS